MVRDDVLVLYVTGPRRGEVHLRAAEYVDESEEQTPESVEAAMRFVAPSFGAFFTSLRASRH